MHRILLALSLLIGSAASAQTLVARQGDDSVRLTEKPCTHDQVVPRLPAGTLEHYRAATARFQGKDYSACWRMFPAGAHMVYEDGDEGIVPKGDIKPELGT